MAAKSRAIDKNLSKLGNRFITTMLKNEKLVEKELEKKMKAIKDLERKSMVKICETSLDVKYDIRRKRNTQDMEEQIASDTLKASLGQERALRSPSMSRRGSYAPVSPMQDDTDETASISSQETSTSEAPAIFINNERKDNDSEHDPESRRSSVSSLSTEPPSETPSVDAEPPVIDDAEALKMLKVFSQSARGSHRRRTAPEITDLSPKLLIQMAKSSSEVKRRGSTHDLAEAESLEPTPPASTKRRGSATVELMQSKQDEEPLSPSLRRRGYAAVANSSSKSPLLGRRGSAAVTNSKNGLSLELNESHLREKISEQAPLSPRLKQPLSPLLGRRSSGVAATLRPISGQPSPGGSRTDGAPEPMLPELSNGLSKRPSSPSIIRRSLSPVRPPSSSGRPSTARTLSSLSADGSLGQLEASPPRGEYDLTRRRGSRPGSARSCYSVPPGAVLLPLDRATGNLASRRGSELSQIDLNILSPTSPLRKAMEDPEATLNPAPVSPSVYRRHSGTVEALQDRVDDFLKSLATKSS